MPRDQYPDAGARDVLRSVTQPSTQERWNQEEEDARRASMGELLDDAVALFHSYGLRAQKYDNQNRDPAKTWGFSDERGRSLVLCPGERGALDALMSGRFRTEECAFTCPLIWDRAEKRWLGTVLADRDFTLPGYPLRRLSALETLIQAIVRELRLGEQT